jgi:hypothetical protein
VHVRALPFLDPPKLDPAYNDGTNTVFVVQLSGDSWDVVTWPVGSQHCVRGPLTKLRCDCSAASCVHRTAVETAAEVPPDDLPDPAAVGMADNFKPLQPYSRGTRLIAGSPPASRALLEATTAPFAAVAAVSSTVGAVCARMLPSAHVSPSLPPPPRASPLGPQASCDGDCSCGCRCSCEAPWGPPCDDAQMAVVYTECGVRHLCHRSVRCSRPICLRTLPYDGDADGITLVTPKLGFSTNWLRGVILSFVTGAGNSVSGAARVYNLTHDRPDARVLLTDTSLRDMMFAYGLLLDMQVPPACPTCKEVSAMGVVPCRRMLNSPQSSCTG